LIKLISKNDIHQQAEHILGKIINMAQLTRFVLKSAGGMTKIIFCLDVSVYYCLQQMFLSNNNINNDSFVTDIVTDDYRTAAVFRKYGIDYCCCGKVPLQVACEQRGLDAEMIKKELRETRRTIEVRTSTNFNSWSVDFLVDYILNVHHAYLIGNLPDIVHIVEQLEDRHRSKYPYLPELVVTLRELRDNLLLHMEQEEKIIFPYIKQIAHAYERQEPYASLLVRTLRKPVENIMQREHEYIAKYLHRLREFTGSYSWNADTCVTQTVAFSKMKEMDNDLVQHIHLEANILFPKALAMEKEMLASK
jgi:regulator of cell morphogenesis and NO signaling